MKILAYDPYILQSRAQRYGAELVSLDRLLRESDVISINTPLTDETRHMIGRNELNMMKSDAILVNTSRGAVIDQNALIESLNMGEIKSAGLDVFEEEPLSNDNSLLKMENVVLTPHIASSTVYAVEETFKKAVFNILAYLEGRKPNWIINEEIYQHV
jgi:D-3-phosphoglycerate dehydrogenase